jgi:hypothetical protein
MLIRVRHPWVTKRSQLRDRTTEIFRESHVVRGNDSFDLLHDFTRIVRDRFRELSITI